MMPDCQVDLRFMAPEKKGTFIYTVLVKSDSYIDQEYTKDVKVSDAIRLITLI